MASTCTKYEFDSSVKECKYGEIDGFLIMCGTFNIEVTLCTASTLVIVSGPIIPI